MESPSGSIKSSARSGRWKVAAFLISLIVGAIFGWICAAIITYLQPRYYESQTVVQIHAQNPRLGEVVPRKDAVIPYMLQQPQVDMSSEMALFETDSILLLVMERLDLTSRWDEDRMSVVGRLAEMLSAEIIKDTDLVKIKVRHTNANDARDIAAEVAEAYKENREGLESKRADASLYALDRELRDQEDLVEDKRKVLDTIVHAMGIPYVEGESQEGAFGNTVVEAYQESESQLMRAEVEFAKMSDSLKASQELDGEGLTHFVVSLGWESGPALGVEEVRARVQAETNLAKAKVERMRKMVSQHRSELVNKALESHDLVEARREYEKGQEVLQEMKRQHIAGRIAMKMPSHSITIHELPKVARTPISPDVERNLSVGLLAGLIVGGLVGLMILLFGSSSQAREQVQTLEKPKST